MKRYLLVLFLLTSHFGFSQKYEFHSDDTYKIKENGNLIINCDGASVTIKGTNRSDAWIKIDRTVVFKGVKSDNKEYKVEVREDDGNILVREVSRENSYSIGSKEEEYTIMVEVPATTGLKLIGDDGDFDISGLKGKLKVDLDDSDMKIENCLAGENRIDLDDSELKMRGGSGEFILGVDDSEVHVEGADFSATYVDFDDSELVIGTSLADNGKYKFTGEGEIDLVIEGGGGTIEIRHDDSEIRSTEGFEALEEREGFLKLKVGSGSAQIDFNVEDSEIDLVKK